MLHQLNALAVSMYLTITGAARNVREQGKNFLSDERGLSGVVVAILLILVAVLAVVAIWAFLGDYIQNIWEQITNNSKFDKLPTNT